MKIYKKQVKKHEEVWAEVPDYDEAKVKICLGNSNYGRLYIITDGDEGIGFYLSEEETAEAFKLLKEIWKEEKNKNPFSDD